LLEHSIEEGAVVAAIGPYTNLALLEKRSPGILRNAHLYLMGGYVFPPRQGFPAWDNTRDYNVQLDVQSAQHVFQRSNPRLLPISVTVETWLRRAYLATLRQSGPLSQLIARQAEAFAQDEDYEAQYGRRCEPLPKDIINFQHDPLTCAIAPGWNEGMEICEILLKSEIQNGSLCQRPADSGKPTKIVTRVDGSRFSEFWLSTVGRKNAEASIVHA
jgi:purine nucleosidase